MVFQVRDDVLPKENFMRSWEDYKVGFGDFDREFWLGNILIWALTNVSNNTRYELAVDMEDWSDNRRFARYRSFRLGSERDAFRLYHQNLYYGNAGDSLYSHNGMPFSTFDVDNDNRDGDFTESSCARLYKGGWWYGNCKYFDFDFSSPGSFFDRESSSWSYKSVFDRESEAAVL